MNTKIIRYRKKQPPGAKSAIKTSAVPESFSQAAWILWNTNNPAPGITHEQLLETAIKLTQVPTDQQTQYIMDEYTGLGFRELSSLMGHIARYYSTGPQVIKSTMEVMNQQQLIINQHFTRSAIGKLHTLPVYPGTTLAAFEKAIATITNTLEINSIKGSLQDTGATTPLVAAIIYEHILAGNNASTLHGTYLQTFQRAWKKTHNKARKLPEHFWEAFFLPFHRSSTLRAEAVTAYRQATNPLTGKEIIDEH